MRMPQQMPQPPAPPIQGGPKMAPGAGMPSVPPMPQGGGAASPRPPITPAPQSQGGGGIDQFKSMLRQMDPGTLSQIKQEVDTAISEITGGAEQAMQGAAGAVDKGIDWLFN